MDRFSGLLIPFILIFCMAVTSAVHASANMQDDQETSLGDYFGFEPLEVIRVGRNVGPVAVADMNGNGLNDLIIVNNHLSRIEIHYQKPDATPDDEVTPTRVNEFPELWRYQRETVSVTHRVTAVVATDFNNDGRMDLIYAGQPGELVFLRQTPQGRFEVSRRHRVRNLASTRGALAIADVIGDAGKELISLVDGEIHIWPLDGDNPLPPVRLSAGATIASFAIEDFTGNGRMDVAGMIPDDAAPIRMWFGSDDSGTGALGPQHRFNMPSLRRMTAVRLPNHHGARLAVIEQTSRRIVISAITTDELEDTGSREAAYEVFSFTDPGSRTRDLAIVDLDGNGLLDIVTTDVQANAVAVYSQQQGKGLQAPVTHASLSELAYLSAAHTGSDGSVELFVMSEREGVVGRSRISGDGIAFPAPLSISDGYTPVAMNVVDLQGTTHVAVVARENRDHIIDLLNINTGERETIELGSLGRSPETIVALDADQDGRTDLLLFTRDRPMVMLHNQEDGFKLLESRDMGQFGLVQAARAENTAMYDIDNNGHEELLVADRNYIRALRYTPNPAPGVSPGWQVVKQINANERSAQLVSLTLLGDRIVAADRESNRIVIMDRQANDTWRETESLSISGFSFDAIHAGSFNGDGQDNILAVGSDGFAVIRLAGQRITLRETDAWRSNDEVQLHHTIAVGDINNDGFTDLIALDAGEQMADIFTFTQSGRMLHATAFQIYESRIFTGGQAREFQPNQAIIADVTGDGAADMIFVVHDRVMIYPQMTPDPPDQRTSR
jgi:hypothetical protein